MEALNPAPAQVLVIPHTEMSSDQYHSEPDHISSSQLVHVLKSPAHFQHHLNKGSSEPSDIMKLGTAAHCLLLEPHAFNERFIKVSRSFDLRRNADKEALAAIREKHPGKEFIEPKEWVTLEKLMTGIKNHAKAKELLSVEGESELSIFWRDDLTGLDLKVRIDRLAHNKGCSTIVEVKTTDDASIDKFRNKVLDMDYDLRAVMYADAVQKAYGYTPDIAWLVIERETGFVTTYAPTERMRSRAIRRYEEARIAVKHARASNHWPSYQTGDHIEAIDLPKWVRN